MEENEERKWMRTKKVRSEVTQNVNALVLPKRATATKPQKDTSGSSAKED
jgi:hypothetical protein